MNWKHILFALFLSALCLSCINKKAVESENTPTTENPDDKIPPTFKIPFTFRTSPYEEWVYVAPPEGLNLRSTYSTTGAIVRLLPQNTELKVLERNEEKETIDGLHDYWYMVDTGNETGWVFGGYLFHKPVDSKFKNPQLENHDWLTDFDWFLQDGRRMVDPSADEIDWIGPKAPHVFFHKFDIPSNSILYQARLRKETFFFSYQTEEKDNLFFIGSSFETGACDLVFENNFTQMSLKQNGWNLGRQKRVGQQANPDYPIVGIWGSLPYLTEYRLVDPADCVYYMEIDRKIPDWAVRRGTYLLKQTGNRVFESISPFPDGRIRIEIKNERLLLLTPLFTLPDEEGLVDPLGVHCNPKQPRFIEEE